MSSSKDSKGLLILFSAPSGAGKTTIVGRLLKRHPDWIRSISVTTREPREGEKDGKDYFFVTPEIFSEMKKENKFLESANVFGMEYGTPKEYVNEHLSKGKTIVLAIDVQGMKLIKRQFANSSNLLTVFILPPSIKVLKERLEGRKTDSEEIINKRLTVSQEEIKQANDFHYTVVNQNLEQTILEIDGLISEYQKGRDEEK